MFPGCPEHCDAEGTLSEYSGNVPAGMSVPYTKVTSVFPDIVQK